MDRRNFDRLITILDSWSNSADHVNDHGTVLIGHEPSIAPVAYRHLIYAGITAGQRDEFQSRVGRSIPAEYSELLGVANGMVLFNGAVRVYGYVQLDRWGGNTIHNFPPNVLAANDDTQRGEAAGGGFLVGWYKEDSSHVCVDSTGRVIRSELRDDRDPIDQWSSISHWLVAEIDRLGST